MPMQRFKLLIKYAFVFTILSACLFYCSELKANDVVYTPVNVSHGLSDNQIRYISQLRDGRMVFTTSGNVNVYDGAGFSYIHRTSEHIYHLEKYLGFYRVYQEGDSLLWIKDYQKLMCIDLRKSKYISNLQAYFKHRGIKNPVEDFYIDNQYRMWLLNADGLRLSGSDRKFDLPHNKGNLQDLATENNHLYLFYSSGQVVCYEIGTRKQLYSAAAYPGSEQNLYERTSLVVKGKKGFYQLRNGKIGGLFYFNPGNRKWSQLLRKDYTLNTLMITPEEIAYITCPKGIWTINPANQEKHYIPVLKTIDGHHLSTEVSTIFLDQQGGYWLGTLNRGLLYYHPARYKFMRIERPLFLNSPEDVIVQSFAEDAKGDIYMRSQSGYYKYQPHIKNTKVLHSQPFSSLPKDVQIKLAQKEQDHIFQNRTYTSLCKDAHGWVWGGTQDGLELFIPGRKASRKFYTGNGLSNNFVHSILEDKNRNIWITTSYGISKIQVDYKKEEVRFSNFNPHDGTLDGEYADGAAFEASDGTLYFGGIDGFNVLPPRQIFSSPIPLKPVFTELMLYGQVVIPDSAYDKRIILSKTAPYTNEIQLSYDQNFLSFVFSALNYRNQAQTVYRYQLSGIDDRWHETPLDRPGEKNGADGILRISYTNLPPGKYMLKVMATDNSRRWYGAPATLSIIIYAPWWKTTTACIVYAALSILLLVSSIKLYLFSEQKKLERRHKEDILLLRIRNLVDQCNQYEEKQKFTVSKRGEPETYTSPPEVKLSIADTEFLTRAIEQVEKHIHTPGYSVEQLSRDLCMERTGLYRKLITLLDQSPSLFIRNIRLQRAAQLILNENLSIAEITEKVGFSSSSYLSKCFQEMYGCRPSEYADKMKA